MSDEAVTKQIEGTIDEVIQKNGWTSFKIDTGGQYTTKLDTKIEKIIAAANAVGDQKAVWTFKESDSDTENPNKPGTFYKNRRLEKVEVGGTIPAAAVGGSRNAPKTPDERRSIERQTVAKAAAPLLFQFPDGPSFFEFCDNLAAWVADELQIPVVTDDPDSITF